MKVTQNKLNVRAFEKRVINEIQFISPSAAKLIEHDPVYPLLTDYHLGAEPERRDRLCRVIGYLSKAMECSPRELKSDYGLLQLHDHKGGLISVLVACEHTSKLSHEIWQAWENECEYFYNEVVFNDEYNFSSPPRNRHLTPITVERA